MSSQDHFLIYGATGYTGKLIVERALARGLKPILSGRNQEKLDELASETGLEAVAVRLDEAEKLRKLLRRVPLVLHCAGPFSSTAEPMVQACMDTQTHYLDITGEINVFEYLQGLDREARALGIMVMPGVGFDVVPTDCTAKFLKEKLPDATSLELYVGGMKSMSPGTAKTMFESVGQYTQVRRDGKLRDQKEPLNGRNLDFGNGENKTLAVSWGDVSTAYYTTGIPNITVFFESTDKLENFSTMNPFMKWFLSRSFVQNRVKKSIEKKVRGPKEEIRENTTGIVFGFAVNKAGTTVGVRMETPEGYNLTAQAAVEIVNEVLNGNVETGFKTPAGWFGSDLITRFDRVSRKII